MQHLRDDRRRTHLRRLEERENLSGGAYLADEGKDLVDGVPMCVGIQVRHGVGDECQVVAVFMGRTGGGLDADTGGDSAKNDLGYTSAS